METMITSPLLKGDELTKGDVYAIRLTDGRWVRAKFLYERSNDYRSTAYYTHRRNTHFVFTNIATGRTIEIKSRQRIRSIRKDV